MKTYQPSAADIKREWHLKDAKGAVLGRLATEVARLLIGKHKKTYVPHLDSGDFVVVTNAKEVVVTGRKAEQKVYYTHSGYSGGLKARTYAQQMELSPVKVIERAVYNMLPKNRLRDVRMNRLKVFVADATKYQQELGAKKEA